MEILYFVIDEWKVISEAPVTFIVGAALIALSSWLWARAHYADRIATLETRITLRDDQLADYKVKLDDASPEDIRNRLNALEDANQAMADELKKLGETDFVQVYEEALHGGIDGGTF